jgi:hypothetical protein
MSIKVELLGFISVTTTLPDIEARPFVHFRLLPGLSGGVSEDEDDPKRGDPHLRLLAMCQALPRSLRREVPSRVETLPQFRRL